MKFMLSVGEDRNKSCRSVMIQLLVFMILQICVMVQSYAVFKECANLKPLRYCPDVHSSGWEERAGCKKCPNGTKYHCCKDYDSPKSPPDCQQDKYDCVTEKFVEGCAKVKYCGKGEEPVLSFIKNQQATNKPTVYCVPCHNVNRYNDHSNRSSADFSECFEKQNICTPERNKIECNQSDSTDERYCRCDARNGYSPFNYANDHPSSGCSFDNYECKKTLVCPKAQELLLNYTCGDLCKEGFYRSKDSDVCIPVPTTSSTLMKRKVTKLRNVTTSPLQNTASTVTLADWSSTSTKTTSTLATSVYGSGKTIIISVFGVVLIIAISIIIGFCVWKNRNQGENAGGSRTSGEGGGEVLDLLPVDDGENAGGSRTSGEGGREVLDLLPVDDGENASGSRTSGEGGREVHRLLPVDDGENGGRSSTNGEDDIEEQLPFPNERENGGRSSTSGEDDIEEQLPFPKEECVEYCLRKSRPFMVDHLEPKGVLDSMNIEFRFSESRDILEEKNKSEMIRSLLDKIFQKGPKCYVSFRRTLKKTKQNACYNELLKHEQEHSQMIELESEL